MKIEPELEVFFIAVSLQHGTPLKPTFGAERVWLSRQLTQFISDHPGKPFVMNKIHRNYIERDGNDKYLAADNWFFAKIADAYLDWLYSQPESVKLAHEAMVEADKEISGDFFRKAGPA